MFTIINTGKKIKLKFPSFVSEGKGSVLDEGELYYDSASGKWYYGRKKADNTIESVEIVNIDRLNALVQREILRFDLYPWESKDNWFMHSGICKPVFIGYQFRVDSLKVGVMNTIPLVSGTNSVIDPLSELGSPVVVPDQPQVISILNKTYTETGGYAAGSNIGLYFNGKVTAGLKRQVCLVVNGGILTTIDFEAEGQVEDSGGGSPLNKLYTGELTIEPFNGILSNQTQN